MIRAAAALGVMVLPDIQRPAKMQLYGMWPSKRDWKDCRRIIRATSWVI
jgi:hypothetical protein